MLIAIKNQVRQSTLNIQKYFSWHHSRPLDLAIPFFLWRLFWNGLWALRLWENLKGMFFAALQCGQHCRLTILDGLAEFGKYQCQYHTTRSKNIFWYWGTLHFSPERQKPSGLGADSSQSQSPARHLRIFPLEKKGSGKAIFTKKQKKISISLMVNLTIWSGGGGILQFANGGGDNPM